VRIYLIGHYYPPEVGAPQARLSELAKFWQKHGHEVVVLTGFPNHPTGIIPIEYRGKIFQKEILNGVEIWRHWLFATPNKGFLKKIIGHISFMFSCLGLSLFRGKRPDWIVVSSPTLFSVLIAYLMGKIRRVPFIFEVRDLWPGIFVELGVLKNPILIKALESVEMYLYRKATKIVVVTQGFKMNISSRGISDDKITVITNGVDLSFLDPNKISNEKIVELKTHFHINNKFVVLYMGAHGISHGLEVILEVAKKLRNSNVVFLFVGDGAEKEKLIQLSNSWNLDNVIFHESVERNQTPLYYSMADACLVPLKNIQGFETFIPSKMFEIMALKRPILASVRGEAEKILIKSGSALISTPENADELVANIEKLKNDEVLSHKLGESGREFVEKNFDREKLANKYLDIMRETRT